MNNNVLKVSHISHYACRFSRHGGKGYKKNIAKLNFQHELDLADFVIEELQSNTKYELFAVTDHQGMLHSGHYKSFCKRNNR